MKKIIIGLVLLLVPAIVLAAPTESNGSVSTNNATGIQGSTIKEKQTDIKGKLGEILEKKEQIKVLTMEKVEIRTQTKAQLQLHLTEMKELKLEMKTKFEGFKDLTAEDRAGLKGEIEDIKSELKSIHVTWLDLRAASRDEIKTIKDSIQEIITTTEVTPEETDTIETVLDDLNTL